MTTTGEGPDGGQPDEPSPSGAPGESSGLLFNLFGRLSWDPPPYLRVIGRGVAFPFRQIAAWRRRSPRVFRATVATVFLLATVAGAGFYWHHSQPQPERVGIRLTAPAPMALEEDAEIPPLLLEFDGSAARLEDVGKTLKQAIVLEPRIAGEWKWLDDQHLRFDPRSNWPIDQEFVVRLAPELFPPHVLLEDYAPGFETAAFKASVANISFYQDPLDPSQKKVVATLRFSHPVDPKSFEERVSMRLTGDKDALPGGEEQDHRFTIEYDDFHGEAYIHSEVIPIPPDDAQMVVTVTEGVRPSRGGNRASEQVATATVPGMFNYFKIEEAMLKLVRNEKNQPEQVLIIRTSVGVSEEEVKKGLNVMVLPKHRPEILGRKAVENYRWHDVAEIGKEVRSLSTPLALRALPNEQEFATVHSFRFDAEPKELLYLRIERGLNAYGGYVLAREFDSILHVPNYPSELEIMHEGSVLSLSGERKLSVLARGITSFQVSVGALLPGQINHLVTQTRGSLKSPHFVSSRLADENLASFVREVRHLEAVPAKQAQYSSLDFSDSSFLGSSQRKGLFILEVAKWDAKYERAVSPRDRRLILITDLGVLVKENNDQSRDIFVQSLKSGEPIGDAQIEVLGKNGVAVFQTQTNERGHARIPSLKELKNEKKPVVYIVRTKVGNDNNNDTDMSFLPYDRRDRALNFSAFDIGGISTPATGERLRAFLFSDRGIYRPGDTVHTGLVVRSTRWSKDTEDVPIQVTVRDPRGRQLFSQKMALSKHGFDAFDFTTQPDSPTGKYLIQARLIIAGRVDRILGSTSVRVEEFLPDRMRIRAHMDPMRRSGWVSPKDLRAHVSLHNLYGTPATDRRISGRLRLVPAFPRLPGYEKYQFFDPRRAENSLEEKVGDLLTDDAGEVTFELDLDRFANSTYSLIFEAEGYEAGGGRSVTAESRVLVSPLEKLIGYKADGKLDYIHQETPRSVEWVAIDASGSNVGASDLEAQLLEIRVVSVLTRQSNGTYRYESKEKEIQISRQPLTIPSEGLVYALPTAAPGHYALVIRDAGDTELNRVPFNVVGPGNISRDLEQNAELQVKLDRTDYESGQTIELEIKAPYTGAGLITIEADRVYTYSWFKTDTTASVQRIQVPAELEGNGYVVVSFLRAADSAEIFMSPLSSAAVPFSVSRAKQTIALELTAPELGRPGELFEIEYSTDQESRIVVFAVDEGILQVADYSPPEPLDYFFQKRALEVQTLQILDLLLPEFSLVMAQSGMGGGLEQKMRQGNLNPFRRKTEKPAVFWSGILDAGPESRTIAFIPPDSFNGSLRVMAVAVSADAIGVANTVSEVRGHFVLSPSVPTFVAPGDRFEISVTVANNVEDSGEDALCRLTLDVPKGLQLQGDAVQEISISEGREKTARFELLALDKLGAASLRFTASYREKNANSSQNYSQNYSSKYDVELSLRPSLPFRVTTVSGFLNDDKIEIPIERKLYPEFRKLEVSASSLPVGLARGLVGYLNSYPYGCTEQLVSRGMPALAVLSHPELSGAFEPSSPASAKEISEGARERIAQTIEVLQSRQNRDGAFGFWAANSDVSEFQTLYGLHFLIEANDSGYPVPVDLLGKALGWAEGFANEKRKTLHELRLQTQAIYLLTRSGQVTSKWITPLRKRLEDRFEKVWRQDLAAAYLAGSYALLKESREAHSLIRGVRIDAQVESDYNQFYDPLMRNSQLLLVLAHDFPDRISELDGDQLLSWVEPIILGDYNTVSSAYTILAMSAYAKATAEDVNFQIDFEQSLHEPDFASLESKAGLFVTTAFSGEAGALRITAKGDRIAFYQVLQEGFDTEHPSQVVAEGIEVQREYRNGAGEIVSQVILGEEVEVHLKIRANRGQRYENVAVVDLLPGGFEVVRSDGLRRGKIAGSDWRVSYVDIREDRILIFGAIDDGVKTFVYRIKATNAGHYTTPPPFAESMYDRRLQALGVGSQISVERPPR